MNKIRKYKNVILIFIIMLIIVNIMYSISFASNNFNIKDYKVYSANNVFSYKDTSAHFKDGTYEPDGGANNNLFCAEHGDKLRSVERPYRLVDKITIKGNNAKSYYGGEIKNKLTNGRIAYAIHNAENNHERQKIIWYWLDNWMTNVGKLKDENGEDIFDHLKGFTVKSGGIAYKNLSKDSKEVIADAKSYADDIDNDKNTSTTAEIKQNNKDKVSVQIEGGHYKIGPINLTFNPKLSSIYVDNQNGETLEEDQYCFLQNGVEISNENVGQIESKKNFYLLVNRSNMTNIKITARTKKPKGTTIDATIAFFKSSGASWQNLVMVETKSNTFSSKAASVEIPVSLTGNLKIEKVDKNNHNIKLGGVGFTLKNSDGKYVDSNGQITDTETTLYTDEYGNRTISNIPIGSYTFTETINPHYGYEVTPESITINIQGGQNSKVVENEQKYIKITGKVWEDVQEGKGSTRNNQLDEKEHILGTKKDLNNIWTDNVKVYLKKFERDSNNKLTGRVNTIGNYTTTWDGAYGFDNVEVKYLEDYFVEFEYNGLTYQCVNSGIGGLWENENSSKAGEDAKSRENLNNKFSIIENGGSANKGVAKDPTENNKIGLDYTINDHVATLNGREDYYKEGWNTTSNTYNALLNLNDYYKYLRGDKGNGHPVSKVEEISNVNLGLYKREEPDLAVQKDVQNVQVEINGYGHTYNYDRKETLEKQNNEDAFNVGVKFGSKYTEGYELPIYESDSNYRNEKDPSKELKVYITYKVRLKNQATTIDSKINSLVDYYDSTYEKNGNCDIRINENINDTDKDGKLNSTIEFSKSDYNDKYKKLNINTKGISIGAGETKCIYIQFGLSRTQIASIINDKSEEGRILKNVVEINSYSSYYKGTTNPYGGIDKDSAPGNAVPGDQSTYEDDTDTAPTLKLEVKEARKLTGKVFLDSTNGTLMTGQIREGDGEYKDGEEGIKDITVTLKPINKDPSYAEYSKKTNENGDFTISGFIPNEYEVIYTWGGQELKNGDKITLDKYKGTAYKERERYTLTGPLWYRQNANKRLTDAIDNYEKRQEIDGRYKSIDHNTENIINSIQNEEMSSTTPKMSIRIENMRKRRKNNYIIIR